MVKNLIVVGVFIGFDVATGFLKAWHNGAIDSSKLRAGLFHKLSEIIAVVGSKLLERGVDYVNLNVDLPLAIAVTTYISIMELISIIENICEVNPKLKALFKPYLNKLKGAETDEKRN